MQITLRRAATVQQSILTVLRGLALTPTVRISIFEANPAAKIEEAELHLYREEARRDRLSGVLTELRKAVARANSATGVDDLLCDLAGLDREIEVVENLAAAQPREADAILSARIARLARSGPDAEPRYGSPITQDVVSTNILSKEVIESRAKRLLALRQQRQALKDKLADMTLPIH